MGFVRVLDEFGNQISVPHDEPLIEDGTYTLLADHPAVDSHGYALPMVAAARDTNGDPLRGKALDDALTTAGLPTTGKVAAKQARLAEHNASLEAPNPNTSEE